jgi:hypothetical protein
LQVYHANHKEKNTAQLKAPYWELWCIICF